VSNNLLRITTWNLLNGRSLVDGQADAQTLKQGIDDLLKEFSPDIIGIQEVDFDQVRSGRIHQAEKIAEWMGAKAFRYHPTVLGTPGDIWSAHDGESDGASYGIALISKIPVRQWHVKKLKKAPFGIPLAVPTPRGVRMRYVPDEPRVAIAAELEDGTIVAVTHLSFVPGFNVRQLRVITRWLSTLGRRVIMVGDFNLPWGLASKLSGLTSLTQSPSYPSWDPKVQFDYILASHGIEGREFIHQQGSISDHRPISAVIG
jgi:endonuclease/exonuclease/phosphatase family metal-dependent hydrolase